MWNSQYLIYEGRRRTRYATINSDLKLLETWTDHACFYIGGKFHNVLRRATNQSFIKANIEKGVKFCFKFIFLFFKRRIYPPRCHNTTFFCCNENRDDVSLIPGQCFFNMGAPFNWSLGFNQCVIWMLFSFIF